MSFPTINVPSSKDVAAERHDFELPNKRDQKSTAVIIIILFNFHSPLLNHPFFSSSDRVSHSPGGVLRTKNQETSLPTKTTTPQIVKSFPSRGITG
jgi:hypothetical protein